MNKIYVKFLILFISFFCFSCQAFSAEVLQVSSSTVLLIGDNNRNYTVRIACAKITPESEEISFNWLKKQLPRHTKVNLKPKGVIDGVLVARVIPINSKEDVTDQYIEKGLAENEC